MSNHILSAIVLLLFLTTGRAQVRVRLVGGPGLHEGRLEVYYRNTWGTVCDDYFGHVDAGVVCYMLGYGNSGRSINNRYRAGSGRIWLDDVRCRGTETSIADCLHRTWGINDSSHSEDVAPDWSLVTAMVPVMEQFG